MKDRQPGQMSPISHAQSSPNTCDIQDLPACLPGWLLGKASEGLGEVNVCVCKCRRKEKDKVSSHDMLCLVILMLLLSYYR